MSVDPYDDTLHANLNPFVRFLIDERALRSMTSHAQGSSRIEPSAYGAAQWFI